MRNRNALQPGRIALTDPITGETKYYILEMADEPLDEGTPLTKANLFDDDTQALYPDGTETVNDALRVLIQPTPIDRGGTGADSARNGLGNLINGCQVFGSTVKIANDDTFGVYRYSEGIARKIKFEDLVSAIWNDYGFAKIETGSYVGTGTFGQDNPCSLTFSFKPKLLIIANPFEGYDPLVMLPVDGATTKSSWFGGSDAHAVSCTANGNTVSWYSTKRKPVIGPDENAEQYGQMNASEQTYHYIAIG